MAAKKYEIGFIVLILSLMLLCKGAFGQSSGCASTLMSLSPCLNYVSGNMSTPSSSCCSSLDGVVQSQPQCLCSLLNSGGSLFGYSINQTLAMALPAVCNVSTPPVSRCNGGANGPATAPAPSPSLSSPTDGSSEPTDDTPNPTNDEPSINSGSGSKTGPTTNGSTILSPVKLVFSALFIAIWTISSVKF